MCFFFGVTRSFYKILGNVLCFDFTRPMLGSDLPLVHRFDALGKF